MRRESGILFGLMGATLLAAVAHLGGSASLSGSTNGRRDDDEDDDYDEDDDGEDTAELSPRSAGMVLSNLKASQRHASEAIAEIDAGANVPEWAADRVTRAQQHLNDVSDYLKGRRG